jgi:hypothetical protein
MNPQKALELMSELIKVAVYKFIETSVIFLYTCSEQSERENLKNSIYSNIKNNKNI